MQRVIVSFATKDELADVLITNKADEVRHMARNMFDGRVFNRATHIFSPHSKEIEDVYAKAGKRVVRKQEEPKPEPKVETTREGMTSSQDTGVDVEVEDVQEEKKHWSELSWPKMRSKATEFTDEPIKSKEQAKEILEKAESEGKL